MSAPSYKDKVLEMQQLTQKYVQQLIEIWTKIFDNDVCKDNLEKLVEHATNFYEDLVTESMEKEAYVENEIKKLETEAEYIKRLLKVDFSLKPKNPHSPLLVVQSEMDSRLTELREQLRLRKEQIYELLLEQDTLCEELGEQPLALQDDPLPTADKLQEFREHLDMLMLEKVERLKKLAALRREIKMYLNMLELEVSTETEDRLLNDRQIKLTKETFAELKKLQQFYGRQVQEVRERIDDAKAKLETLWDRLDTSPHTRNKFRRYTDYNQRTFDVLYGEMSRCQTLKSQNIKLYVNQIRQEIKLWWDKTLKSEVQRARFSNFNSNCYTDDLLVLHEMELEDLKTFYENNKEIFQLYEDRKILWDRMMALEAKSSEPGRYNNRGGQLLKEEKERKMIASKLPKIEKQITELVKQYEECKHSNFLVHGENIIEVMAMEWAQKKQVKEQLSSARKHGLTPLTPLSAKNVSSASKFKTPLTSTSQSGKKRKLNHSEKQTPVAKRSLIYGMSSPGVFLKPTNTVSKTPSKSPQKKSMRVLATTIRRRSGRRSAGAIKKRRSMTKSKAEPPNIIVSNTSVDQHDDNYDSFEKCIEPSSRSSIKPNSFICTSISKGSQRLNLGTDTENTSPRTLLTNTSPKNSRSPAASSSKSKPIIKNLPLLI